MIRHIVFWNLKDKADLPKVKETLESLPSKVPGIEFLQVGEDFNQSEAAFDVCLVSDFKTKEALQAYQVHPEHVEVAKYIGSVVSGRAVVDFEY